MRISKKILACVLAALMAISMMPFTAFAASDVQTEDSVASITANSVTTYYDSLAEAIAACPDDASSATTIKLLADVTTTATTVINNGKNIKLNLNSKSITSANVDPMFKIEGGKFETTSNKGTIESTTNDCTVFRVVGKKDAEAEYSKLIIGSSTTVYGKEYGILIPQSNHYADGVYVKVSGKMETGLACIYTNGNINQHGTNPATILVNGLNSKLTCTDNKNNSYHDNAAVYAAGYAVWTFSGGSVTGPTALYAKCGTFDCWGTSFSGKGDAVAYSHNGNGITATGEAIVLENCAGYSEDLNFSITKGNVTSANADPFGSYAYSTATDTRVAKTGFVGLYSTGVGPVCKSKGEVADVSEFYNDDLAAKFASGNAYIENSELGGTEGLIRGEAPGAKVVRGDTVLYAGNIIGAANFCQPGETAYALKDHTNSGPLRITNQDVTIDLQGHTITNTSSLYPLRVMDYASATITNGTVTSAKGLTVETDSKLVIDKDCTVNANIDNYDLTGVQNSTVEIYGTVNGSVTTSKSGSVVNVYDGAEINNASGTAINAKAGTTINVYGGEVNGAVAETGTGEVNISGGTFDTDVTEYLLENYAQDLGTGVVYQTAANTGASMTVAEEISQNLYIDADYYEATYGDDVTVKITYNHASNVSETPDFQTETIDFNSLPALDDPASAFDGAKMLSVLQAPAQATEPITIRVYDGGVEVEEERVEYSVYKYCTAILDYEDEALGAKATEVKNLAKATLDYAAAAQNYFNYNTEDPEMLATKDNSGNFYGDIESADFTSVPAFSGFYGQIKGATVVVKSELEINLITLDPIEVVSGSMPYATNGKENFAVSKGAKNGGYNVIHIAGIVPANMDEQINVSLNGADFDFTANTIMKIMSNSSDSNMATLAKAMYLYGQAANAYFD